ncbi:sperm tail-domain-containing protein [Pavlovales sp. CCMP2436]|nr:sperm tail-domain-containing protein [Pavlovales sp. CCMP2436]
MATDSKEARIALRRTRIEARVEAKKAGTHGDAGENTKSSETQASVSRSTAQTVESRSRLDKVDTAGGAHVTDVRARGDNRENERRIEEEKGRQGRRQKLLYEAESSARQNAAVAMKWSSLFEQEIPQELLSEIELQRDTCSRIIASKDFLVKEFKSELKGKARAAPLTKPAWSRVCDDEYVKALKRQADDVETLLGRMGGQHTEAAQSHYQFHTNPRAIRCSAQSTRRLLTHNINQT